MYPIDKILGPVKVEDEARAHQELIERTENSPFAAALFDDNRCFVAISDSALSIYHGSREEMMGARLEDFIDVNRRDQTLTDFQVMIEQGYATSSLVTTTDSGERAEITNISIANIIPGLHLLISLGAHRLGQKLDHISVLVAAPKPLTADLISSAIDDDRRERVIAKCTDSQCADLNQLAAIVINDRPDVVVIAPLLHQLMYQTDSHSPEQMVATISEAIKSHRLSSKILLISSQNRADLINQVIAAGASGVLGIADNGETIRRAVAAVSQGESYVSPSMAASMFQFEENGLDRLTKREREVLKLIALGYTNQECAAELFLSPRTIESHRAHINHTLGLKSRKDLVAYAFTHQVIP